MLFRRKEQTPLMGSATNKSLSNRSRILIIIGGVLFIALLAFMGIKSKNNAAEGTYQNDLFSINLPKNFYLRSRSGDTFTFLNKDVKGESLTIGKFLKVDSKIDMLKRVEKSATTNINGDTLSGVKSTPTKFNKDEAIVVNGELFKDIYVLKSDYVWRLTFTATLKQSQILTNAQGITESLKLAK